MSSDAAASALSESVSPKSNSPESPPAVASCSRRSFLQTLTAGLAGVATATAAAPWLPLGRAGAAALPAVDVTVGHLVLAPRPPSALQTVTAGARMGADEAGYNAEMFGGTLTLSQETVDSRRQIEAAAQRLLDGGAQIVIAHVDDADALLTVANLAREANALVWNTAARDDSLRTDRCHPHLVHVEASDTTYAAALTDWIERQGDRSSIAFVTDDSPEGRRIQKASRGVLEASSVEILGEHVLQGEAAKRIAAFVQEAQADLVWLNASGEAQVRALRAMEGVPTDVVGPHLSLHHLQASGLPPVGVWPVLWHPALFKYGASQVSDRFAKQHGQPMHSPAYANWAAVSFAVDTALQAEDAGAAALRSALRGGAQFDGRKGAPLTLRPWNQQLRHELYVVRPGESEDAQAAFSVSASVPHRIPEDPSDRIAALDALALPRDAATCSMG